jgi:hypothetical protein
MTSRTPSTVVWEHLRRISGKCIHTFIPALSVNGVTAIAQNEVADALLSYFETASSSAIYAPTFLLTKVREESRYLNFTTRVAEPYNSPFSMDELLSANIVVSCELHGSRS